MEIAAIGFAAVLQVAVLLSTASHQQRQQQQALAGKQQAVQLQPVDVHYAPPPGSLLGPVQSSALVVALACGVLLRRLQSARCVHPALVATQTIRS